MSIYDELKCIIMGIITIIVGLSAIKLRRNDPIMYLLGGFGISIGIVEIIAIITLSHLWR